MPAKNFRGAILLRIFSGRTTMSFVVARWVVGIFTCISMVHLYWAAGGKLGSLAAIPPTAPANLPAGHARRSSPRRWALSWWRWGWSRLHCWCACGQGCISRRCPMAHCNGGSARLPCSCLPGRLGIRSWWVFSRKSAGRGLRGWIRGFIRRCVWCWGWGCWWWRGGDGGRL